jgi:hypothetical protein
VMPSSDSSAQCSPIKDDECAESRRHIGPEMIAAGRKAVEKESCETGVASDVHVTSMDATKICGYN